MSKAIWMIVLLSMLISEVALAAGNPQAGEEKSAACRACHGANGKATAAVYPDLAGQKEGYLLQALLAYKNGGRSGGQAEVMKAFVAGLSDEDMANLAAYYASLKP
ncbi:cytochrome C554 [Izhakiella australiensis]|uniref:Cytochrome C554 n=2 Tax=Izhakiella australiensis TaxID=1926881 RepID=A0A1S8YM14_9GAMM|nr:cytochrome C554 [Izhakiella australiensis]